MAVLKVLGLIFITVTVVQCAILDAADDTDFNVWDNEVRSSSVESDSFLSELCDNFHLLHENQLIDCSKITFYPKLVETDDFGHVISKRDAEELEGSGDVPETPNNQTEKTEEKAKEEQVQEPETKLEDKQEPEVPAAAADGLLQEAEKATVTNEDAPAPTSPPTTQNVPVSVPQTTVETVASPPKEAEKNTTVAPPTTTISSNETEGLEAATTLPPPASSSEEVTTTVKAAKEAEPVDDKQSGIAVLFKEPTHQSNSSIELSDSDKLSGSLATNAQITNQTSNAEEPKTGESSVEKAGKDTTILVVLFVVVIVIGAAAFTHNFIKKRRQRSENSDIVDGIRRSLQNLSATKNDVEQGTEMKPLMKNGNNPVIVKEYSDKKSEQA